MKNGGDPSFENLDELRAKPGDTVHKDDGGTRRRRKLVGFTIVPNTWADILEAPKHRATYPVAVRLLNPRLEKGQFNRDLEQCRIKNSS